MKEQMTTIKMKTNDMERHCNLLLNRVLAECNISLNAPTTKVVGFFVTAKDITTLSLLRYPKGNYPSRLTPFFLTIPKYYRRYNIWLYSNFHKRILEIHTTSPKY